MKALNSLKMILVDDQSSFQVIMKSMLFNMGITGIKFAEAPEEARRICQKEVFDVYLIDYNLGVRENGRQLLESLRAQKLIPLDAIVIIISGDASRAMVLSALETEPDAYIAKPFSQEQLRVRLKQILAKKDSLEKVYQALASGQSEQVIGQCDELLTQGTRYTSFCQRTKIDALFELGRFDEVQIILDAILKEREQLWARLYQGILSFYKKKYADALRHFFDVIERNPLMIEAYHWIADASAHMKDHDQAKESLLKAIEFSPESLVLQEKVAQIAMLDHDYESAKDALHNAVELSKYSIHDTQKTLGFYLNSMIMNAVNQEDSYHIDTLKKNIINALSRAREFVKHDEHFDFEAFEKICLARVDIALGDIMKGKKQISKVHQDYADHLEDLGEASLYSSIFAMYQLGEHEYAEYLKSELKKENKIDLLAKASVSAVSHDPRVMERIDNCHKLNSQGIHEYQNKDYAQALSIFKEALIQSPGNTNAAINKAQVLIKLLEQAKQQKKTRHFQELDKEYVQTLELLEGVPMTESQQTRYAKLLRSYSAIHP